MRDPGPQRQAIAVVRVALHHEAGVPLGARDIAARQIDVTGDDVRGAVARIALESLLDQPDRRRERPPAGGFGARFYAETGEFIGFINP